MVVPRNQSRDRSWVRVRRQSQQCSVYCCPTLRLDSSLITGILSSWSSLSCLTMSSPGIVQFSSCSTSKTTGKQMFVFIRKHFCYAAMLLPRSCSLTSDSLPVFGGATQQSWRLVKPASRLVFASCATRSSQGVLVSLSRSQ